MVAPINNELLSPALLTPGPDLSDSDDVLLAIETARALETQGEIREAVRWLRRAANEAEKQGNDERVLVLARAAADMSSVIRPSLQGAEAPTMPPPSPDTLDAGHAQYPPTTPPPESFEATIPPPAAAASTMPPAFPAAASTMPPAFPAAAPTMPPPFPAAATISNPPEMPFVERSMRIGAIRVAIKEASVRGVKSFFVERLDKGELPPAGTTEAMLVFTGEADGAGEQEVDLLAADSSRS